MAAGEVDALEVATVELEEGSTELVDAACEEQVVCGREKGIRYVAGRGSPEFLQTAEREAGREGSAASNAHGVVAKSKSAEFGTVARLERFTEETHVTVGDATVWE